MSIHVKSIDQQSRVKVIPYYKPKKLSSQFSNHIFLSLALEFAQKAFSVLKWFINSIVTKIHVMNRVIHVIGYTTQKLENRIKQHRYKSSSICKHFMYEHDKLPSSISNFVQCFDVLFASENVRNLKIVEAIKIKSEKPHINVKYNEFYDSLQLF